MTQTTAQTTTSILPPLRPSWVRYTPTTCLLLLTLLPLLTFFHKNELGHWTTNRCAMVAPDEVSYLWMARNFMAGAGPSLQSATGAETFYPPGFPGLMALGGTMARGLGVTPGIEFFHFCVTMLLCASVPLVYRVGRRMLGSVRLSLAVTSLYVTNWFVLETGVFVLSEAAFTTATLLWLLVGLRWPRWFEHLGTAGLMIALALAAGAIRSAGLVCVAATVAYPLLRMLRDKSFRGKGLAIVLGMMVLAGGYYKAMGSWLPRSPNSYGSQLIRGVTDRGKFVKEVQAIDPQIQQIQDSWRIAVNYPKYPEFFRVFSKWGGHLTLMARSHFQDWAEGFMPPLRESEDAIFTLDRPTVLDGLGKALLCVGVAGWLMRMVEGWRRGAASVPGGGLVELYVLLYILLYALWPFNMTRFWVPLFPVMLMYVFVVLSHAVRLRELRREWVAVVWGLWLTVNVTEMCLKLPYYQRRLNYVSDILAETAKFVAGKNVAVAGADESLLFSWYLNHAVEGPREKERIEAMLARRMAGEEKIYVVSYFTHDLFEEVFGNLHSEQPELMARWEVRKVYQRWNITAVWEVGRKEESRSFETRP